MRNEVRGDVWKVWLYAAATVVLGAWVAPWLYNAGKALAEVSSSKTTNGPLEWLAGECRTADFPRYYEAGLLLAAVVLFFPWLEWLHAISSKARDGGGNPWVLRKNPRRLWHGCVGFLGVAGLLLPMGMVLVPAGFFTLRQPQIAMGWLALRTLADSLALAVAMEVFFRGIALGIFLRAMRPAVALGLSAAFFALVISVIPPPGLNVADPEAAGTGFEMLHLVAGRFADWRNVCESFAPLLALGGLLAHARWRTASLWLPIGLHTGWLFAKGMLSKLTAEIAAPGTHAPVLSGTPLQQTWIPLAGILLAGVLTHYLTANHDDEKSTHS